MQGSRKAWPDSPNLLVGDNPHSAEIPLRQRTRLCAQLIARDRLPAGGHPGLAGSRRVQRLKAIQPDAFAQEAIGVGINRTLFSLASMKFLCCLSKQTSSNSPHHNGICPMGLLTHWAP